MPAAQPLWAPAAGHTRSTHRQHWQEGAHFVKGTQDINLIGMSFRGSKRKVAYERNACIKLLEKSRRHGHAGLDGCHS